MNTRFAILLLVVFCSACNSPGYIRTSEGESLRLESAAFIPAFDQSGRMLAATVVLGNQPELCRSLRSGRMPKKLEGMMFQVVRVSDRAYLAPDVGEYTVITSDPQRAGSYAMGAMMKGDLNCNNTLAASDGALRSGFITIDQFDTGRDALVSGTIDATYGRGDDVTGRFTAEYCEVTTTSLNCQ